MRRIQNPLAFLLLLAATSTPAHAGDEKIYPAFLCEEAGSAPSGTVNRSEFRITRTGGSVGTSATVHCPVLRDIGTDKSLARVLQASVDVLDAIFEADIACTFRMHTPSEVSLFYQTRHTTGVLTETQAISFDFNGIIFGSGDYVYSINCRLPTNSPPEVAKIFSYRVTEL